jgi:hypothetical protein
MLGENWTCVSFSSGAQQRCPYGSSADGAHTRSFITSSVEAFNRRLLARVHR